MQKKSFEELREFVTKKFAPVENVPYDYLNDHGKLMVDMYDELDNCFCSADSLEDYVQNVKISIDDLLDRRSYWTLEFFEHQKKVAEKLRKFVRFHIANELWENIPAFARRKEN